MSKKLIVCKFGGTSLADASAIKQSAKVASSNGASLVVVSASGDSTNELLILADLLTKNPSIDALELIENLRIKHQKMASELKLESSELKKLESLFLELSKFCQNVIENTVPKIPAKQIFDHILAYGEFASSILIASELSQLGEEVLLIDAREVIKTDDHHKYATPLVDEIKERADEVLVPKLRLGKTIVTQGFIGQAPDGSTTTLGRGGSDYSAALFGEALRADELQIWSDVAGIATADPRIVTNTRRINYLTFQEAAELATSGAKILYPKTITPARRANIPVYVGNTFKPEEPGTWIEKTTDSKPVVRAVSLKTNQSLVTLTTEQMAQQFGYLAKIFTIIARHKVSIDQISTSEISVAFTLDNDIPNEDSLLDELKELADITIEKGISVVSLIGNDINNTPGLVGKIFSCLETKDSKIAIRMICQGASKHNFCFLVADKHGEESVIKLHKEFIEG